jgi:MoxR-like ATPase
MESTHSNTQAPYRNVSVQPLCQRIAQEVAQRVVGQEEVVDFLVAGLFLNGHVLLEGVPGLGKTLLAKTLAEVVDLKFSRVQFTPDLMPADILGTHLVSVRDGDPRLTLQKGPLFSNVVLADEINRASPKTQSALLEAMQEAQISLGDTTYALPPPFYVIATQNPVESEGTYPLPDAQLDRFLMKLNIAFPSEKDVTEIVARTTAGRLRELTQVADSFEILRAGRAIHELPVADVVVQYAVRLMLATHPESPLAPEPVQRYANLGASPRAAQALVMVGKFLAIIDGRLNPGFDDIRRAAKPCLRHRIRRNFDCISDGVTTDDLVDEILRTLPHPRAH